MPAIDAKPYEYSFDPLTTALVVIDMQRDFLEPGGFGAALGNKVERLEPCVKPIANLLAAFRKKGLTIVHTKECHKPDLSDCPLAKLSRGKGGLKIGDPGPMGRILIDGEPGADFVAPLKPVDGEWVLAKPGKGSFCNTDFESGLRKRGITHLMITGVTTEVCVQTTMREANDRGYECLLIEDGTESYFPDFKASVLEMVRAQGGIVGWTATSTQVITALNT
jgi:nicotinamidase-related amidase